MRKGILAMEDLGEERVEDAAVVEGEGAEGGEGGGGEEVIVEGEVNATAPEAEAMAEVESAEAEVIETDEAVGEAEATAEVVDEVREHVEEAVETEGGVSEPEARALDVAVEHMLVTLGVARSKAKVFPAMEGFKQKETRVQATKVALESISGKLQALWKAIIANIQRVFEICAAFVKALINGSKQVELRAKLVMKMAAKKKGAAPGEVSTKGWGSMVSVGGKIPDGKAAVAAITALGQDSYINYDYGSAASKANATIVKMLDQIGKEGSLEAVAALMDELEKETGLSKTGGDEAHALPMGGASIKISPKRTDGHLTSVEVALTADKVEVPEKVEGLSPEDANQVAQSVLNNLKKFAAYEKQSGDIAAAMKSLTAKMSSMVGKVNDAQKNTDKEVQTVAKAVSALKSMLARASTLLRSYDLKSCQAALKYAGASVSAAGAKAAAAAKEGAAA
jgi:hypothetical protein